MVEIYITNEIFLRAIRQVFTSYWIWLLLFLIFIDVVLGIGKSMRYKVLDSTIGTNGLIRHAVVLLLVISVAMLTRLSGIEGVVFFSVAFCIGFIFQYLVSILENLDSLGVNLPPWVRKYFNKMRERYDSRVENSLINYEIETTNPDVENKEIIIKNEGKDK